MYEPLMWMRTTGQVRTDFDGALVESGEYVAALYEWEYAEQEWNNGATAITRPTITHPGTWREMNPTPATLAEYGESLASVSDYVRTACRLTDELGARDLQEVGFVEYLSL